MGGIESNRVVDVPRERIASPGADSATTVAGLSPVNGAITQSEFAEISLGNYQSHELNAEAHLD